MSAAVPTTPTPTGEDDNDFQWNGLNIEGPPFGLEKIIDYGPGGHHPIHLGDHLSEGRYRVVHKLGSGGFANVWLCRDTESLETSKYVAVKVLMSDVSTNNCPELEANNKLESLRLGLTQNNAANYICFLSAHFRIDGPNGSHLCFVYPVLGPVASSYVSHTLDQPDKALRDISLKTVQAIELLHSFGICHGDLSPSNVLLKTAGLDGLTEDEVVNVLGKPRQTRVVTQSGETPTELTTPKYLIYPIDWSSIKPQYISDQPCIIDFGESFEASDPPEDVGIPGPYRSPELHLNSGVSFGCDLWALGCSLFEIRTGRKLFDPSDDEPDEYLDDMVRTLGKLPEPWWSSTWTVRTMRFQDETDSEGRVVDIPRPAQVAGAEPESRSIVHPSIAEGARSLKEKLAPGLWYLDGPHEIHREISVQETEIFADLLSKVLNFNPKERLSAKDIQDHEWFKM